MKHALRLPLVAVLVSLVASVWYARFLFQHPARREALEGAGDRMLPGSRAFESVEDIVAVVSGIGKEGGAAYGAFVSLDNWFVPLLAGFLLSVAWALLRNGHRRWPWVLALLAIVYAAADWTENALLRAMLAEAANVEDQAPWARAATDIKWLAFATGMGFAFLGLFRLLGSGRAWWLAFFQDVPHVVDSVWRRAEFRVNREFLYVPSKDGAPATTAERSCWSRPAFLLYALTVGFIAFGPTPDPFCSLAPSTWSKALPYLSGVLAAGLLFLLAWRFLSVMRAVDGRFPGAKQADDLARERYNVTRFAMLAAGLLLVAPLIAAAVGLIGPAVRERACAGTDLSWLSWGRLAICAGAISAFGALCRGNASTARLVWSQAAIAAVAAALLWLAVGPEAKEAGGVGYRHVFGALAPALLLSLALAPLVAAKLFRRPQLDAARDAFRDFIARRELFVARTEAPEPGASRVFYAAFEGAAYRTMQILLPPSLFAFVAPGDMVEELTWYGFAIALLLSTWGNMSRRWRHMSREVDRFFLTGTAYFVSLFVIVMAIARVAGIDYVTTILDAAPFGVLFALVVMSYTLSWLVEYWINRVLGEELLRLLGVADSIGMRLPRVEPGKDIRVAADGRMLYYHSLGRFLVVGTLTGAPASGAREPTTAFHTYDLLELFRALAGGDSDRMAEVQRYSGLYFYVMNVVVVLVFAAFSVYAWMAWKGEAVAVVAIAPAPAQSEGVDLAERLLVRAGAMPALVLVASGGGTRAALYTSHVLDGLHRLGVSQDIVLASGVSGGGVALAYFVAHHADLTSKQAGEQSGWEYFRRDIGGNLIRDVLEGASEWRVAGATPLSMLLAESFERNLLSNKTTRAKTFAPDGNAPALILNTTMTSHPAEESDLLKRTLDHPRPGDCGESARSFSNLDGGRLIFTNLQATSGFPSRDGAKPGHKYKIPDTRLPYVVVADSAVEISRAAALNANFPPVFPNARVRLAGRSSDGPCAGRSYHVTDGGAEENLGLVSALYGVLSALEELGTRCGKKCDLRPIHFVIAEASATGYDHSQDRGLSAGFGGSKERMTGGLTNELEIRLAAKYRELGGKADRIHFHYLPLPLTFRARGGFGTHWMLADEFELNDPRPRAPAGWRDASPLRKVTVTKQQIEQMWLALHDPRTPYCENRSYGGIRTDRVRRWICGARGDQNPPRDLHITGWQGLVKSLKP